MRVLPSVLWKDLSPETRLAAAAAFWRDDQGREQQIEAIVMLARRLKFREKSIQALPVDRRAAHLAHVRDVSDTIATRALIAYHFQDQRPLMAAFLDALGLPHEDGLITAETVAPPEQATLEAAVAKIRAAFPEDAVTLYLRTLLALDGETWAGLDSLGL